jgi:Tfp pilus assembly protein PilP
MLKLNINRFALICLVLLACVSLSVISRSFAQAPTPGQNPGAQPGVKVGPDVELFSTTYREPKTDPFFDEKLLPVKPKEEVKIKEKAVIEVVPPPSFEDRDISWKEKRQRLRDLNQPEPGPSEKYLIDELKILGIYKKPDGQGVFLKPTATASTMIFAGVGQEFWNGKITRIEKDKVEFEVRTLYSDKTVKTKTEFRPFTRK